MDSGFTVKKDDPQAKTVNCCKCGAILGMIVTVDEEQLLSAGVMLLSSAFGRCQVCGTGFNWSTYTIFNDERNAASGSEVRDG